MNTQQSSTMECVRIGEVGTPRTRLVPCHIVAQQRRDDTTVYLVRNNQLIATAVRDAKTKMLTCVTALGIGPDDKEGEAFFLQHTHFNKPV